VLPFGIFAGMALIGIVLSIFIRGEGLEAEGFSDDEQEEQDDDEEEEIGEGANERTELIRK
jgi:hypothetical protein